MSYAVKTTVRARACGAEPFEGLDPVGPRHLQIQQYHIRLQILCEPDDFVPVGRLADHLEVRLGAEHGDETLAQHRVVVGDEEPDLIHPGVLRAAR